uniref:Thyroglobulin type-1 domain-containing protein n=1 Tax=Rousettus aegyptiacus TaxID=9407 RepID=A0A7J8JGZ7_ROUAE|nr:hypothetical protein HJG63_010401 [Rousettus aegyptiacus]
MLDPGHVPFPHVSFSVTPHPLPSCPRAPGSWLPGAPQQGCRAQPQCHLQSAGHCWCLDLSLASCAHSWPQPSSGAGCALAACLAREQGLSPAARPSDSQALPCHLRLSSLRPWAAARVWAARLSQTSCPAVASRPASLTRGLSGP